MDDSRIILLITYLGTSVVMVGSGIPLYRRRIRRNRWFGFRTAAKLNNDAIWYAANQAAGRWLILAGISTALSAIGTAAIGLNEVVSATLITTAMLTGVILGLYAGFFRSKTIQG